MKEAYEYTKQEFYALTEDEQFTFTTPAGGARPSNTNYHFCAILEALRTGLVVEQRVLESYEGTARYLFKTERARELERQRVQAIREAARRRLRPTREELEQDLAEIDSFLAEN